MYDRCMLKEQILVAVCIVEFTGLNSNFLACFTVYT